MTLLDGLLSLDQWRSLRWGVPPVEPLLRAPFPSSRVSSPTVIAPGDSIDWRWHLWAHTPLGLDRYTSDDGLRWTRRELVATSAEGACVRRDSEGFVLAYARTPYLVGHEALPPRAEVVLRRSNNLLDWSPATVALSPTLPWHRERPWSRWVGAPGLYRDGARWRLSYAAGVATLPGGFKTSRFVGEAASDDLALGFVPAPQPTRTPRADDPVGSLGVGGLKVFSAAGGGHVALQHAVGEGGSAVTLLSRDHADAPWSTVAEVFRAGAEGWCAGVVTGLDATFADGVVHVYFSVEGAQRGAIGRVSARV